MKFDKLLNYSMTDVTAAEHNHESRKRIIFEVIVVHKP